MARVAWLNFHFADNAGDALLIMLCHLLDWCSSSVKMSKFLEHMGYKIIWPSLLRSSLDFDEFKEFWVLILLDMASSGWNEDIMGMAEGNGFYDDILSFLQIMDVHWTIFKKFFTILLLREHVLLFPFRGKKLFYRLLPSTKFGSKAMSRNQGIMFSK